MFERERELEREGARAGQGVEGEREKQIFPSSAGLGPGTLGS